ATAAGATVYNWRDILPALAPRPGKGESLWRGVAAAAGDIVVFLDADLEQPATGMVTALAAPFADPGIHLVKADYRRTFRGQPTGGGRVTELTAKPLLRALHPELAHIRQPLAGEYAIRRSTALQLPFAAGYGVEAGLLLDVARLHGPASVTQVDLGVRRHRNRPLEELAPMADVVVATVLGRGVEKRPPLSDILQP
ncbi:glycosyltransferase family protein, partial [Corynebacterium nasicanis]